MYILLCLDIPVDSSIITLTPKEQPPWLIYLNTNDSGYREYRSQKDGSVLIFIPSGSFIMGSSNKELESLISEDSYSKSLFLDEQPPHSICLKDYYIGKFEITNEQFSRFVTETRYKTQGEWKRFSTSGRKKHPVMCVTWYDASRYCKWAALRLPTEAEWERASRGSDRRRYPWGNKWNSDFCNSSALNRSYFEPRFEGYALTLPVGTFFHGKSPFGAQDMAGNVWEWCSSLCKPYPYNSYDGRENLSGLNARVIRGGSWVNNDEACRVAKRFSVTPASSDRCIGFRCAFSSDIINSDIHPPPIEFEKAGTNIQQEAKEDFQYKLRKKHTYEIRRGGLQWR